MNTRAPSIPNGLIAPSAGTTSDAEDRIYRRIGWRLMPVILLAYVMAFLDRINVGYTQLQMKQDLGFSDAVYGLGAGLFFITYLIFEVPSNLWLQRIGARLTFLRIMVLWGLASAATAFVTQAWQFYVIRLLLGIFEAGFFPGVILYLTYWYPSHRRGRVTGLFLFGMPVAGMLGGPLSGMIMQGMDGVGGWHGWQWVFVLEGLPTVLVGVLVFFLLADKPADAKWLTASEKALVQQVMAQDSVRADTHSAAHGPLKAALLDARTYVLAFVYFSCVCAVYTLTFWLPSIIRSLGTESVAAVGWYTAIPYIFGAIGALVLGRSSDRYKERRWHVALSLVLGSTSLTAAAMLGGSFALTMTLLCVSAFFVFGLAVFWSIPPTYLTEKAAPAGIAVISSLGILGGFLSPTLIGWLKSATGSMNAGLLGISAIVMVGALTIILAVPKSALRVGNAAAGTSH